MISATPDKGLWLDIGCGTGWMGEVLRKQGRRRRLVGIDISEGMLRYARQKEQTVVRGDAERLPFHDCSFDGVLAKGVLHHLCDIRSAVEEIDRVVKPGGYVVLADPNMTALRVLKYTLKKRGNHFSPQHRSVHPGGYLKHIAKHFKIVQFTYFGFFAYPAAFPDILPYTISEKCMKILIRLDEIVSCIPLIQRLCWAFKVIARKSKD